MGILHKFIDNTISKAAQFSPKDIEDLNQKRKEYLTAKPSSDNTATTELTTKLIAASSIEIFNAYLPQIKELYKPIEITDTKEKQYFNDSRIKFFDVTKWVNDVKENSIDKLVNVYQSLSDENCNIALIYHRTNEKSTVSLGIVNNNDSNDDSIVNGYCSRLQSAIQGSFPGSELIDNNYKQLIDNDYKQINTITKKYSVSIISNVATEKSDKFTTQTIEKVIDGIVPKTGKEGYTIVLLATPVLDTADRKNRLYSFYTGLAPYAAWQTNYTYSESDSKNALVNAGVNAGISAGSQSGNVNGTNKSQTTTDGTTKHPGQALSGVGAAVGTCIFPGVGTMIGAGIGQLISAFVPDKSHSESTTNGSYNGKTNSTNGGLNFGLNFARSSSITATVGKNEGITQSFTNYNIKHALELLESQMKRMEQSTALGLWDFAAYVYSEDYNTTINVAHMYKALTQGNGSYLSQSSINTLKGNNSEDNSENKQAPCIYSYINHLQHPQFIINKDLTESTNDYLLYPVVVTPTTNISGKELAYSLNFPKKSISGLPVLTCASFGRNIEYYKSSNYTISGASPEVTIGKIFHMNHQEELDVKLDAKSLASHVFITGSTGSGKSNTIYQIVSEAKRLGKKFLVIEPAKGEYKNIFGKDKDVQVHVQVLGTNPNLTKLLRLNPFSFDSKHILVHEHIDRLTSIFNVCWPMYAAMPAVLKEAVEKSYADAGWDLSNPYAQNKFDNTYFPTFADVARNIRIIIDSSEYDAENKGAYKGSLLTRLTSLTNGINGMIFSTKEIGDKKLFDENTIIDLSRIGSAETKSLIMGILVLKLQEYRMSSGKMNSDLNHLTVLEEAHNLLKKTSSDTSSESGNLQGRSVEMISNAIAEMRTYGEGFIIADQAPGLLDMSVIRNTNTKIIMRLPDFDDRELVGKAANLNDDQIVELAKLPCGVAAVYQNEWVEAVLCKIEKYESKEEPFIENELPETDDVKQRIKIASFLSKCEKLSKETALKELSVLDISGSAKAKAISLLQNPPAEPRITKLGPVMSALFPKAREAIVSSYSISTNPIEWKNDVAKEINDSFTEAEITDNGNITHMIILSILTDYILNELKNTEDMRECRHELGDPN